MRDLYQWKTALSRRGSLPVKKSVAAFVPVEASPLKVTHTSCNVTLPKGVRLKFTGELDGAALRAIMTAASRLA